MTQKKLGALQFQAAFAATVLLFALWGMAHSLNDILISQFKRAFDLSDFGSSMTQAAFYVAYLVMPLLIARVLRRLGFRQTAILGLCIYAFGCFAFYFAAELLDYRAFLTALFVVACGITFLETAGFGLVYVTSPADQSEFRLQLASAFNPIGAIAGIFVGQQFIFSDHEATAVERASMTAQALADYRKVEAHAVQTPYLIIGCILLLVALAIRAMRFPPAADERDTSEKPGQIGAILGKRFFVAGVATQFCYVGTQIGMWSFMIRYAQAAAPALSSKQAAAYLSYSLIAILVGRFASLPLLNRYRASQIGLAYAVCGAALTGFAALAPSMTGVLALIAASFAMSVMYPAIYSVALEGNADHAKPATALMTMSITGGAIFSMAMGALSDYSGSVFTAYLVPAAGFLVVATYFLAAQRRETQG